MRRYNKAVNQLLQAASAYYYANCTQAFLQRIPVPVSLQELQAVGGLQDANAIINPWAGNSSDAFQVKIISGSEDKKSAPYLVQLTAGFPNYPGGAAGVKSVAGLLSADIVNGTQLGWVRLPDQALKNLTISMRTPGGWMSPVSGMALGGQFVSSSLWVMSADLANFSQYETDRIPEQGRLPGTLPALINNVSDGIEKLSNNI